MNKWGEKNNWTLGSAAANHGADQQVCGQTYIELYNLEKDKDENKIKAIKLSMDELVQKPTESIDDWFWVDAIYMAMPVFSKLGVTYNDKRYFDQMYAMYQNTKETRRLYDTTEHLWFRDGNSFKKSPNGKKIFWSRGNGWALAAYAKVINDLPKDSPIRNEFITTFKEMADAIITRQRGDGFWNVNLADPDHFGGMETSGTALFIYGLSWGVNNGILDKNTYLPTILKAWNGLTTYAVHPSGLLGYVQGAGWQPESSQPVTATSTADFGVGAFLLAGSELIKMAPGVMPTPEQPIIDVDVTASTYETGTDNSPEKTLDRQFSTRWSAEGEQWIMYDLRSTRMISSIDIAFYVGEKRNTLFSIDLSTDGKKFTQVFNGQSGGKSSSWEKFSFIAQPTRYVRINGKGNTQNKWNSISEVRINDAGISEKSLQIVTDRIVKRIIANGYTDPTELMNLMRDDGSWPNIDYSDTHSLDNGWDPGKHFNNLTTLSIAYRHPDCSYYRDSTLLEKIVLGCEFVSKWNYPTDADNWWWNTIGDPQQYAYTLILTTGDIPLATSKKYASFLKDDTEKTSHQGKNRAWVSEITYSKGCIENNYDLAVRGFNSMASILTIAKTIFPMTGSQSKEEGVKSDYSFHQHRRQIQSGSYGLGLISDLVNTMELTGGTSFGAAFSSEKRALLSSILREGHLQLSYRKTMDFGVKGREISRPSSHDLDFLPAILEKMPAIDPEHSDTYAKWKNHIEKGDSYPTPINKHFWLSDMMCHHTENSYLSAKVISTRTNGTESLNGENIKASNLPCGATNIMTTGEEYFQIFPVWDWNKIPGTTAAQKDNYANINGYLFGTNSFAGGVSDQTSGILAYQHRHKGLSANKSYFFMGNAMVCLGSGITAAHSDPVATTANQCFKSGDIYYSEGRELMTVSGTTNSSNIKWVHHNNIGYIFPAQTSITIEGENKTGSWSRISKSGNTDPITAPIFSLWIDHGENPKNNSYQYIVTPNKSMDEMDGIAKNSNIEILKNDSNAQVVFDKINNQYGIVLYSTEIVKIDDSLLMCTDKPSVLLIKITNNIYSISIADPTYSQKEITLSINKTFKGEHSTISPNGKISRIVFDLPNPNSEQVGHTKTRSFIEENTANLSQAESSPQITLYPNPVSDILHIVGINDNQPILLLNAVGNLLLETQNKEIDMRHLINGVYFIKTQGRVVKMIKNDSPLQ